MPRGSLALAIFAELRVPDTDEFDRCRGEACRNCQENDHLGLLHEAHTLLQAFFKGAMPVPTGLYPQYVSLRERLAKLFDTDPKETDESHP